MKEKDFDSDEEEKSGKKQSSFQKKAIKKTAPKN